MKNRSDNFYSYVLTQLLQLGCYRYLLSESYTTIFLILWFSFDFLSKFCSAARNTRILSSALLVHVYPSCCCKVVIILVHVLVIARHWGLVCLRLMLPKQLCLLSPELKYEITYFVLTVSLLRLLLSPNALTTYCWRCCPFFPHYLLPPSLLSIMPFLSSLSFLRRVCNNRFSESYYYYGCNCISSLSLCGAYLFVF